MALVGWFETVNFTQRGLTSERSGGPWYGMVYVWALLNEFSERQTVTKCLGQARGVIMVIEEKRTKRVWAPQKDLRTGHFLRKWNYYILWIYVAQNH